MCFQSIVVIILMMLKSSHLCPAETFSSWFLSPFDTTHFLAIWYDKMFHVHLNRPAPDLESANSPKSAMLLLRNQS